MTPVAIESGKRKHAALRRGHDDPRAIRTVGRHWTRILRRCWQDGIPYQPDRH